MEDPDQIHPCAICLDGMVAGGRQAIFTAECRHAFHLNCIAASVAYGHLLCPLCKAQWRDLPTVRPPPPAPPPPPPPPPPRPMRVVQPPLVRLTSSWPLISTQQRRPPPPPVRFVRGRPLPPPPPPVRPSRPPMPTPRPPPPLPVNFVNGQPPPSPPQPVRNGPVQSPPPPPPPVCFVRGRPLPPPPPPVRPSRPPMPTPRPPPPLPVNFVNGQPRPPMPQPVRDEQVQSPPPPIFDDDEQPGRAYGSAGAASNGAVVVKTHSEYPAIARDSSSDSFVVLVHVKAPRITETTLAGGEVPRAPLDLVMVLDVSGSMSGHKLALLKQAMRFVIDNLGPDDRLCVVSFSSEARRVTRLTRMTNAGKALSVSAVDSLAARGGTNIAEGLRVAAMVLDERRHRNAVSSVVLLSDGQDTYTSMRRWGPSSGQVNEYDALVPPSFVRTGTDGDWSTPIHTFGFGNDHDAAAMHVIAEATGGTFSFIENEAAVQDAFAQCVGGLLSVVVQEARIAVACVHPGVRVILIKSGRYDSRIDEDGRAATVRVGELYADEERRFLLFLAVPRAEAMDGDTAALVKLVVSYRDAATGVGVSVMAQDAVVTRPDHAVDAERSVEVERERVRVEAAEDIAAAREAAERGGHQEAVEILENRQRALEQSEAARDGDPAIVALGAELREMRGRVSNRQSYMRSGRAYMLAGMSAHQQQRATSRQMMPEEEQTSSRRPGLRRMIRRGVWSSAGGYMAAPAPVEEASMSYATPAMRAMLLRSREARGVSAEQGSRRSSSPWPEIQARILGE